MGGLLSMARVSRKLPRIAAASLCLMLGAPLRTFAGEAPKLPFGALGNSATASTVTRDAVQTGAAPEAQLLTEAQLLNDEEIAELSQRNQDPGPEVRGGALSNEHLTYIVIALAAIVLVLVLK